MKKITLLVLLVFFGYNTTLAQYRVIQSENSPFVYVYQKNNNDSILLDSIILGFKNQEQFICIDSFIYNFGHYYSTTGEKIYSINKYKISGDSILYLFNVSIDMSDNKWIDDYCLNPFIDKNGLGFIIKTIPVYLPLKLLSTESLLLFIDYCKSLLNSSD